MSKNIRSGWSVRRLAAVSLLAAGLLGAGCGDDDEGGSASSSSESSSGAEEVTLSADEYDFELSATPTSETKSVTFDNQGEEFHVMIFARINEGFTLDEAVKMQGKKGSADVVAETEAAPGQTSEVEVKGPLEPGDYAMLCPIGGPKGPHYKLGQLEEFRLD